MWKQANKIFVDNIHTAKLTKRYPILCDNTSNIHNKTGVNKKSFVGHYCANIQKTIDKQQKISYNMLVTKKKHSLLTSQVYLDLVNINLNMMID